MLVTDFKDLRVYRGAFETAMLLYTLSEAWPASERYAMTDQVRRSSRAVCANLAEAWFKRRYPKHFVSKLSDAGSEAAETLVWIQFAERCGHLAPDQALQLNRAYQEICGGLVKMMAQPERWCGPSSQVREDAIDYGTDG